MKKKKKNQIKIKDKTDKKQIKINQEKLLQSGIFHPIVKDPDPWSKFRKNYFFGFLLTGLFSEIFWGHRFLKW